MKMRWLLYSIPLVVFLLLAYFLMAGLEKDPRELPSMLVNKPLPEFSLSALQDANQQVTQADLQGPALVNIWATWCPSCRVEHPLLMELAKAGIRIYGINHVDEREAASQYLQIMENPYALTVFDEDGQLGIDLGITGAPETYLIDAHGQIRYHHVGIINEKNWREILWPEWLAMGGKTPENLPEGNVTPAEPNDAL